MINHCVIRQNATLVREEMRREAVVCPKPRRLRLLPATISDHPMRPLWWQLSNQLEPYDSQAGVDALEIILKKDGGCSTEQSCMQVASPSPFFCGSPPSRVSNPLIKDGRFGDEMVLPFSPPSPITGPSSGLPSSPSSSSRKGGCVWANFGSKPMMRIEGFDCLNRDGRSCGIPALA
ncbi:hypothetical protein SAY87_028943 [Trapa incisa]|uniref:Uncharacterized protein n=1 Tax=Trapa incisa TaxID=236973 RepID=A0AAN7KYR1_9MYRT|nr:hypothetical protein SAY87_028943 [Trapa incisa]